MIEIKHRYTEAVLFAHECTSISKALIEALRNGANLRYADLRGASLRHANLRHADLSSANLSGANLSHADLRDANLRYADLSGANLSGANLSGANLRGADLRGANLRYADLSGADLRGANLSYADLIYALPVGDPRGYRPYATWYNDQWMVCAGCRYFTIAQAREHWGSTSYPTPMLGAQYVAAMDWLEQQEKPVKKVVDKQKDSE